MNPIGRSRVRLQCLAVSLLCAASLTAWQALTVHYSYQGNWTALFCTGVLFKSPPPQLSENIYLFPNSTGYDGQVYHYVAHDPFFRRGFSQSIDDPRLRYRRILVPGLAFLLALGQDPGVDSAYIFVIAAFNFAGAYWLSRAAVHLGYPVAFGLLFALVPGVLISVDRLTVDGALAACSAGFALYSMEQSKAKLFAVLAAATLVRETGLLLLAAYVIFLLGQGRLRSSLLFSTAAIPAVCWYAFVHLHTPSSNLALLSPALFSGLFHRFLTPPVYALSPVVATIASGLDLLALSGVLGAVLWAFYRGFRRAWTPLTLAIYLFAILTATLSGTEAWESVYAFGRSLTPLLLLCALDGLTAGWILPPLAMLALDPRIWLQFGPQILNVMHGVLRR